MTRKEQIKAVEQIIEKTMPCECAELGRVCVRCFYKTDLATAIVDNLEIDKNDFLIKSIERGLFSEGQSNISVSYAKYLENLKYIMDSFDSDIISVKGVNNV